MQSFSFDFKNIFFSILFFLGTCKNFGSLEPVQIQTPKTITQEKIGFVPGLEIQIQEDKKISMVYKHTDKHTSNIELKTADQKEIENSIQKAIDLSENKEKFEVRLITNRNTKYEDLKIVIDALSAKQIYKYKIITDP